MEALGFLIPVSLCLGVVGLLAFRWMLGKGQFDDPDGDANRILRKDYDDQPKS